MARRLSTPHPHPRCQIDLARLAALPAEKPATKAGQVRWVWPEIRAALASGHKLKAICQRLNEIGIEIGYPELVVYVQRLREYQARDAKTNSVAPTAPNPAERMPSRRQPDGVGMEMVTLRPSQSSHDALANIRQEREKKRRSAFQIDPFSDNKNLLE